MPFGAINGIKASFGKWARSTMGGNLSEAGSIMRAGYEKTSGGFFSKAHGALSMYMGYGGGSTAQMLGKAHPWHGAGQARMAGLTAGRGGGSFRTAYRQAAGDIFTARKVGIYGGMGLGAMGISAATGFSVFDQAQAGVGGYMGLQGARAMNMFGRGRLGTAGGVGMMAGGAILGSAMGYKSWMLGGIGAGGMYGAQAISGRGLGGGYARAGAYAGGALLGAVI